MTEKGKKLTSELNNIFTDLDTFGKNLYTSFNDIDEEENTNKKRKAKNGKLKIYVQRNQNQRKVN